MGKAGKDSGFIFPIEGIEFETEDLDDNARKSLPGKFIKLSDGYTHYELRSPDGVQLEKLTFRDGENDDIPADIPAVIFVHGFSSPMPVWDKIIDDVNKAGYYTLRYDLFGRGYSDRPKTRYNLDLFKRQLNELKEKLGLAGLKYHLVGLSMGGIISVSYAVEHHNEIKTLTLIDPAGMPADLKTPPKFLASIPFIDKIVTKAITKGCYGSFYHPERFPEFGREFIKQVRFKGYGYAIRSTLKYIDLQGIREDYIKWGKLNIPTLLFWGKQDGVIPYNTHEKILQAVPHCTFVAVDDCGHMPQYERPEVFLKGFIKFIEQKGR